MMVVLPGEVGLEPPMPEMVDSVTAVMQSVTEKEEVRTMTERIEARESGVAMQTFWMVESVPVVDAMGRAEAKSHPATMAEATAGGETATSCLDRHHHPSQDETPDKEGEHNSSPHTLPEKAFECVVPLGLSEVDFGALIAPVSYGQWLLRAVGELSIPHRARGVNCRGQITSTARVWPIWPLAGASGEVRECGTFHSRLRARSSLCYLGITCRKRWALTTSGIG